MKIKKILLNLALLIFLISLILVTSCTQNKKEIVVGGKNFTEQYLLSEIARILLEKNGFNVKMKTGVGSTLARKSLENSQIDIYYEYTGTSYTIYHKQTNKDIMTDMKKCYDWVKNADAEKGLIWLDPVEFNNSYTLLMRKEQAQTEKIFTISELGEYITARPDTLTIGVGSEFWERPDGFKPLMELYGFTIPQDRIKKMDDGLVYKALKDKQVDVSMGFATDGRIASFGFIGLEDDRYYFPIYNPAPVIRAEVLEKFPEISEILRPVAKELTTTEIRKLNAMVDIEHRLINEVAMEWLISKKMI